MLFKKYPELKEHCAHCKTYARLTRSGELIEKWQKINGVWKDVTNLEKAKLRVAALQKELDKMNKQDENHAVFF